MALVLLAVFLAGAVWLRTLRRLVQRATQELAQKNERLRQIQDGLETTVTERTADLQLANTRLEQTRKTLVEAQRIAHLGSFNYVAATQTTEWSEEEYRIYGLIPGGPSPAYDEMLAKHIHPDDAALLHEVFSKAIQNRSIYELEHRIVRPDGTVRWVVDRALPCLDAAGKLISYIGTTLDITARKQTEEALQSASTIQLGWVT